MQFYHNIKKSALNKLFLELCFSLLVFSLSLSRCLDTVFEQILDATGQEASLRYGKQKTACVRELFLPRSFIQVCEGLMPPAAHLSMNSFWFTALLTWKDQDRSCSSVCIPLHGFHQTTTCC